MSAKNRLHKGQIPIETFHRFVSVPIFIVYGGIKIKFAI